MTISRFSDDNEAALVFNGDSLVLMEPTIGKLEQVNVWAWFVVRNGKANMAIALNSEDEDGEVSERFPALDNASFSLKEILKESSATATYPSWIMHLYDVLREDPDQLREELEEDLENSMADTLISAFGESVLKVRGWNTETSKATPALDFAIEIRRFGEVKSLFCFRVPYEVATQFFQDRRRKPV